MHSYKRITKNACVLFFGDAIYSEDIVSKELKAILGKRATELMLSAGGVCLVLVVSSIITVLYLLYTFIFEGDRPLPIPVELPYTDVYEGYGYLINMAHQAILLYIGIMGNYTIEIGMAIFLNNLWAAADVIIYSIKKIDDSFNDGTSSYIRDIQFRNVLNQIQDLDR